MWTVPQPVLRVVALVLLVCAVGFFWCANSTHLRGGASWAGAAGFLRACSRGGVGGCDVGVNAVPDPRYLDVAGRAFDKLAWSMNSALDAYVAALLWAFGTLTARDQPFEATSGREVAFASGALGAAIVVFAVVVACCSIANGCGASHPAAVHAGDAAHEKASAKATHGLSQPESRHDSSDVGSGDDQDGTDGGDDETKRCVNGFCSRVARDLPRKHVATGVARGTKIVLHLREDEAALAAYVGFSDDDAGPESGASGAARLELRYVYGSEKVEPDAEVNVVGDPASCAIRAGITGGAVVSQGDVCLLTDPAGYAVRVAADASLL